jgi:tetratricopeptide (TPR) repeat protein
MANFCRGDDERAVSAFERVRDLDSSYAPALLYSAFALGPGRRNWRKSDSVLQIVERMESALTAAETSTMRYTRAYLDAQWRLALSSARDLAQADPNFWGADAALAALALNRPEEAVRYASGVDDEFPCVFGQESGENIYPREFLDEIRALAGLRRVAAVDSLMAVVSNALLDDRDRRILFIQAGFELRAHGFLEEGQRWLDEAISWNLQRTGTPNAGLLYSAGRYEEALPLFEDSDNREGLGATLAALGRREEALAIADELDTLEFGSARAMPEYRPWYTMRRAVIYAQLGDAENAVRLLDQGYNDGWRYWRPGGPMGNAAWLHSVREIDRIRDHPRFKELIRPKG